MLRTNAACEAAGIPSASIVCEGFISQANATSVGLGFPGIALAMVPGHTGIQGPEEVRRNILEVTLDRVVACLTCDGELGEISAEPDAQDIVCSGTSREINQFFLERSWGDGLPITPPTRERVDEFLRFTPRSPQESLGVLLPDNRLATVWNVAVNGVMAGCRPEYMPVLLALAEAMADPGYGVEHSGNTPGAETLIILNGPVTRLLDFNFTQGVMRDGFQPNTSVGRFWRLYLRNVAGFLPHKTDKATYGNTWRVVVPENEEALSKLGWKSIAMEMGFARDDSTVTVARYTGGDVVASLSGSTPEEILSYLADAVFRHISWQLTFTVGSGPGSLRPLILLTPILAETIARAGWSKYDIKKYLFDTARIPAHEFEHHMQEWNSRPVWNLLEEARKGNIPVLFAESDDPNRRVPLVWEPEHYMIAITGDPLRTNAYVFAHNGYLGFPTTRKIDVSTLSGR